MISNVTQAVASRQTVNPRTVLAFYGTVLALLFAAIVGAIAVLASTDTATYLIPWLLGFGGLVFLLLISGVFAITLRDPAKLMLGQITGTEYVAIHKAILGSSMTGEHIALVEEGGVSNEQVPLVLDAASTEVADAADASEVEGDG